MLNQKSTILSWYHVCVQLGSDPNTGKKSVSFSWQVTLNFFNEFILHGVFLQPKKDQEGYCLGHDGFVPTSNMTDSSMGGLKIFMTLWDCIRCERHQSVVLNWQPCHENTAPAKAYESVETWSGTSRYLETLLSLLIIISN